MVFSMPDFWCWYIDMFNLMIIDNLLLRVRGAGRGKVVANGGCMWMQ